MKQKLWIIITACISLGSLTACNTNYSDEYIANEATDQSIPKDSVSSVTAVSDSVSSVSDSVSAVSDKVTLDMLLPTNLSLPLYSGYSIWNQSIPNQPEIDANSKAMVDALVTAARTQYDPTLNVTQWSVPVYVADANTPRYNVAITGANTQYGFQAILDVPIPDGAQPDPQLDGHMVIIDTASGFEYDFWQAKQNADGSWGASWGNRISLDSNGIYPTGSGAKASGFAAMAGIIWPEEFKQGRIDHALFMALPIAASGGPVWPATASDGWSNIVGAIPEGAHLQLDPNLDLNQFDMTPYERIIAEALQTYGAYVGDYSGAVSLYAINPQSYPENPYPAGWFDNTWNTLKGIPWEHMRVLKMPAQSWPATGVADPSIYLMSY